MPIRRHIESTFKLSRDTDPMVSKWDINERLLAEAKKIVADIESFKSWAERTPFTGNQCGCGFIIETEADFAKHFIVSDERYLNLGNCPPSSD